jgi:hypothetical protein
MHVSLKEIDTMILCVSFSLESRGVRIRENRHLGLERDSGDPVDHSPREPYRWGGGGSPSSSLSPPLHNTISG